MARPARVMFCLAVAGALVAGCSAGSTAGAGRASSAPSAAAFPAGNPCAAGYRTAQPTHAYPAPSAAALPRGLGHRLDAALATAARGNPRRSGITAAVVTDRGSWAGATGRALDGSRLRPADTLAVGSITKTFTAAEVLHLANAKQVDLSRRIATYVRLPMHDNGATVRDLLMMRSGFREFVDQPLFDRIDAAPAAHISPAEALSFAPKEVDAAGKFFEYSNTNYLLLGQLVEKVSGVSWASAVHRDVVDPAGLKGVTMQDEERSPGVDGPDPYLPSRAFASAAWSAGSIVADAPTIARWGYLLWGGQLPEADCFAQMLPRSPAQYGFATDKLRARSSDLELLGHGGQIGPYNSWVFAVRGRPVAVAVLSVAEDGINPSDAGNALLEAVAPRP